jgi:hypothetical protein
MISTPRGRRGTVARIVSRELDERSRSCAHGENLRLARLISA